MTENDCIAAMLENGYRADELIAGTFYGGAVDAATVHAAVRRIEAAPKASSLAGVLAAESGQEPDS